MHVIHEAKGNVVTCLSHTDSAYDRNRFQATQSDPRARLILFIQHQNLQLSEPTFSLSFPIDF